MLRLIFLLFATVFLSSSVNAALWIVDSPDDAMSATKGTLTLRKAINDASANDTIIIKFTGSIELTSQLYIDKPLKIIGPAPVNFSITGVSFAAPDVAILIGTGTITDTLIFDGIQIRDFNHNNATVHINPGSAVRFSNSLFKNNHFLGGASSVNGGAISNAGNLVLHAVSFTNNKADVGGAVYNTGNCSLSSCSFQFNEALNDGGAIGNTSWMNILYCTFYQNNAAASGGGGAIHLFAGCLGNIGASMFFQNSSLGAPDVYDNSSGSFSSVGYNMLVDNIGCSSLFPVLGDQVSGGLNFGLNPGGMIMDGYGMEYIPVIDPGASGMNVTGMNAMSDIRKAPRILSDEAGLTYNGDCGAFEYTPFVVTNTSSGTGTINSLGWCFFTISANSISPAYIGFHLANPGLQIYNGPNFNITMPSTTVDGFSQPDSRVPGAIDYITPAVHGTVGVIMDGQAGAANTITIASTAVNCHIRGIGFTNRPNNAAIGVLADDAKISGCHFGSDANGVGFDASNIYNIRIADGTNVTVGGHLPYERNTFVHPGIVASVYADNAASTSIRIIGNYVGLDGNGNAIGTMQDYGYYLENVNSVEVIENVIVNTTTGVHLNMASDVVFIGNSFGITADGSTIIPNSVSLRSIQGTDILVGVAGEPRNVFSGDNSGTSFSGIVLDQPVSNNIVMNNYVGLLKDGVTQAGNLIGVEVSGATASGQAEIRSNVISGNTYGVNLIGASSYVSVHSNLIGLDANGQATGVGNATGVRIGDGNFNQIGFSGNPNYISDNTGNGIVIRNDGGHSVQGNYIGIAANQTTAAGNGNNGIYLELSTASNLIGGVSPGEENYIAHNTANGISLISGANLNSIIQNQIFSNGGAGIIADQFSTEFNTFTRNEIYNNTGRGIELYNNANETMIKPTLLGASSCNGGTDTKVRVQLDGLTAGMNYIVEFFTIPSGSGDPSGFGEGNSYVEAYVHTSISAGTEVFEYTFSSPISPGDLISATVTGPNNSTSEFSNHLVVENEQALTVDLITNESCGGMNDGGITVSTSGGAAPITYEWYNSSIVLVGSTEDLASVPSETYSLYSTSASGCIVSSSGNVVSTDPAISVSATTSNYSGYSITCFGASDGQINLTISGGTGVYSISLDGGATWPLNGITSPYTVNGIGPGTYDVWVANNGVTCPVSYGLITMTEPTQIMISFPSVTDVSCYGFNDGIATSSVTGGVGGYIYSWTTGGTTATEVNMPQGIHTLNIMDGNGCVTGDNVTINQPSQITVASFTITDVDCFGNSTGSIQANGVGGGVPPYNISTDNGGSFTAGLIASSLPAGTYNVVISDATGCVTTASIETVSQPTQLLSTATATNELCNGSADGTLSLTETGGTATYTYSWFTDAGYTIFYSSTQNPTGVPAGTYYPEVMDANGCLHYDAPVTVGSPSPISLSLGSTDVLCNGNANGQVYDAGSSGGTGVLSFNWYSDPGHTIFVGAGSNISGLTAGNYFALVTDVNGCTASSSTTVVEPAALSLTITTQTDPSCNGGTDGSITVNATGGIPSYEFSSDNGGSFSAPQASGTYVFNSLPSGSYNLVVRDINGCLNVLGATLNNPLAINVISYNVTDADCFGNATGSIEAFSVSGGTPPYEISTDNGSAFTSGNIQTGLPAATYQVILKDANNCWTSPVGITVNEPFQLLSTASATDETCAALNDGTLGLIVSGGTPGYSISWYSDVSYTILAYTGQNVTGASAGTYYPQVFDLNGCAHYDSPVTINAANIINAIASATDASCFGSTDGTIFDSGSNGGMGTLSFYWYDDAGLTNLIGSGPSVSALPSGTYYMVAEDMNLCTASTSVTILDPLALSLSLFSKSDPTCNGSTDGNIQVTATGGTPDYEYSINNGGSYSVPQASTSYSWNALAAGSYDLMVRDANGCTAPLNVILADPAPVSTPTAGSNSPVCEGAVLNLTATFIAGATYSWTGPNGFNSTLQNPSIGAVTAADAGIFSVTATVAGCTSTASTTSVIINAVPVFTVVTADPTVCGASDGNLTLLGLMSTTSYDISYNDGALVNLGTVTTSAAGDYVIASLAAGTYSSITVTSASGCTGTAIGPYSLVDPSAPAAPTAGSSSPVCEGGTLNLTASFIAGASYTWTGPNGFNSTFQNPTIGAVTLADAGTFSVTATVSGCTGPAGTVVVVVNAIEDATITSPLTYCDNDSPVTLTSVTPGGTWSATCGTCVNGGTGLFDPVTATAGSYSITYTTSGTCPGTDVQTITVNPYQDATITPAGPFCSGDSPVTLTAATSGGTWTGTGITNSATGVFDPAVAGAGAHSITYTISGACGSTDMVTVTVDLQDDATITSAGPFCDNDAPVTLSAPTAGGTWSATCGTCINGVTGVFDPAAAGGGSYTITYITSGTCPSTDNEIISVNPFLDPTITAAGPFCPNDAAVNLSAASVGGTWSGTGITAPILGTFDPVVAGPGSHTISHTTSGSCGGTDTEVIVVTSPDVVDAGSDASICEGGTYSLLGSFTPSGATGVIWSTSGTGVISTPTSLTPVYTSGLGETGTIWMAVTTTGGTCPAVSDTMQLTISAIEDASFSIANFCEGSLESALITGTPGGTFSFAITPSMGETINPSNGEISGAMGGNIYSVQYATPGVCQDIDTVSITVYSIPGMTVSTTNPTCWNTTDGSIFISAMGSGPFDFSIDNGTSTSNAASTFTFNGLTGGSYSPWVMDANGCVISSTETLNTPATVSFTAVVTDISCNGAADGSIEVTAAGGSGADYHVSFDGGTTFVTIASAGTVDTLSPAAAGTYNIVVTDVNGCSSDTNSYVVAEPAALVISGITTGSDTCGLGTGTIAFSVSGGNSPYGYSLNGGAVQFTPLFTGVAAGTYIIGVGDIDGCIETQMVSVNSATADLSNMINATVSAVAVCPGSEVLLNASSGFDTYSWTGSNISNTIIPNPSAIPDLALNMYIIDVTAGSCTGSDTLYVITADSLCTVSTNVTNAFSPDDDGVNDTWFVEAVAASPNNKVFIYNRWGDVLREFTNYDNQSVVWDGKSASGVVLPTGTYYYIIELQDTSERLSGWVYITK